MPDSPKSKKPDLLPLRKASNLSRDDLDEFIYKYLLFLLAFVIIR
jgi:hypothetical protein